MAKELPKIIELTFKHSHSLIVGHKPNSICTEGLCENLQTVKKEETMASFGLFGGSADVNKFYPELKASDWKPEDADFIEPVFRALSETYVVHWGVPISFKKEGVLKKSMPLLKGATINTNHDTEVENAVGAISEVSWQEAYKVGNKVVPAGINGVFKIDAKSNPRLVRGISMSPPSIHSNSVTVRFAHEPSHPDLENFWDLVGSYDKEGNLIHVVVTDIQAYKETSLVNHGADPYAQKVDESGQILDADYASKVYDFSADNIEHQYSLNTKDDMDFLEFITSLGLTIEEVPDQSALVAHFTALTANQVPKGVDILALQADQQSLAELLVVQKDLTATSLTALVANQIPEGHESVTTEQAAALASFTALGSIEAVTESINLGAETLNNIRANAIASFKLLNGEGADSKIIETINKADLATAKSFETQYSIQLEKELPLKCTKCGSIDVSRGVANGKKEPVDTSFEAQRDSYARKTRKGASYLHGNPTV